MGKRLLCNLVYNYSIKILFMPGSSLPLAPSGAASSVTLRSISGNMGDSTPYLPFPPNPRQSQFSMITSVRPTSPLSSLRVIATSCFCKPGLYQPHWTESSNNKHVLASCVVRPSYCTFRLVLCRGSERVAAGSEYGDDGEAVEPNTS